MYQPVIDRTYLVEVNLPTVSNGQSYNFLDNAQLRSPNIILQGLFALSAGQATLTSNQKNVIPDNGAPGLIVTLVVGVDEEIYQYPYYDLIPAFNGGLIRMFRDKQINLTKSYVTVVDATNLTANQSALFNFIYRNAK